MLGLPILLWDERVTTFAAEEARTGCTRSCGPVAACGRPREQEAHRLGPTSPEARRLALTSRREPGRIAWPAMSRGLSSDEAWPYDARRNRWTGSIRCC
jgi:hypothetical protein